MMAIYEGKWYCAFCGVTNRGRDITCAKCGARRGSDVDFFLDPNTPEVTDEDQLKQANDGSDWLCETCGGSNRFIINTCETCGAPLGSSKFRETVDSFISDSPEGNGELESSIENSEQGNNSHEGQAGESIYPQDQGITHTRHKLTRTPLKTVISVAITSICLLAFISNLFTGQNSELTELTDDSKYQRIHVVELAVDRIEWRREIQIEEYRWITHDDWKDLVPADARLISQEQGIHHYDQVKIGSHIVQETYTERVRVGSHTVTESYPEQVNDGVESYRCGTRNKGNGYFEAIYCTRARYRTVTKTRSKQVDDYQTVTRSRDRVVDDLKQVPVYQTRIKYSVKRWVPIDVSTAHGTDMNPYWPKVSINSDKREGERKEIYQVFLYDVSDNAKRYERKVGANEFTLFIPGARCVARINGMDQIVDLALQ